MQKNCEVNNLPESRSHFDFFFGGVSQGTRSIEAVALPESRTFAKGLEQEAALGVGSKERQVFR